MANSRRRSWWCDVRRLKPVRFAGKSALTLVYGRTSQWPSAWTNRTRNALDYYLLPRLDMTAPRLRLAQDNGISLDAYRFETLEAFLDLAARAELLEVA